MTASLTVQRDRRRVMGAYELAMQMGGRINADAMEARRKGPTNEQIEPAQKRIDSNASL
jgi:hypothetical protein